MHVNIPNDFYLCILSILILSSGAIFALMQRVFPGTKKIISPESLQLFILAAALTCSFQSHPYKEYLGGSFVSGHLTQLAHILILSVSLFISLLFRYHPLREAFFKEESSFLYLIITAGLLVFTSTHDLVTLLVALEISSLGGYTILGYLDPNRKSLEGAIKYFILGSVATAFILFGFGFLYASSGALSLKLIAFSPASSTIWFKGGFLLFFFGLCFKLALAPFHLWTPDAYESAPTGISALLATSFKTAIVILLLRMAPLFFHLDLKLWVLPLSVLIFLSVIIGNIMALSQTSIKRILAYSSVAHSAFIALALCSLSRSFDAHLNLFFYLFSYTLASLLAFGSLMFMEVKENQNLSLEEVKGYSKKNKWLSFTLSFALLSLAGLPPTIGFLGKLFVFKGAIQQNLFFLTITAILGSCISLFYYLRIIVCLYMEEEDKTVLHRPKSGSNVSYILLGIPLISAIFLGTIFPQKIFDKINPRHKVESSKNKP